MTRIALILLLFTAGSPFVVPSVADTSGSRRDRPNILLILVDDLGYSDLGCYGNPHIDTPNIDRLASEGMRFTDAYAMPVCTPTRVSLISGMNPATLHIQHPNPHNRPWGKLSVPPQRWELPRDVTTIAEALENRGYESAHIGKWGCGETAVDHGWVAPSNQPPSGPYASEITTFERNNPHKALGRQVRQAVAFIEEHAQRPFFCTLSPSMVHTPPEARDNLVAKYQQRFARQRTAIHPEYAAMCEMVDEAVGLLSAVVSQLKLQDRTLILFYSDNGGTISERGYLHHGFDEPVTINWPLRGEKGTLYEGGVRVPLIARWTGKVPEGTVCRELVSCEDFFPTLCELAGAEYDSEAIDGHAIVPLIFDQGAPGRDALYWHHPRYHHSSPASAIRRGRYKLIQFYEDDHCELYDLQTDIGERRDLAAEMPDRVDELRQQLASWLTIRNAALPMPNPDYDPGRELIWGERNRATWHERFGIPLERKEATDPR